VCLVARVLGIPIVLHESDAVMGRANQLIARWARVICLGFPLENYDLQIANCELTESQSQIVSRKSQIIFTGNPIRPEITKGSREEGLRMTGFSGKRPILLVIGGSQGAQAINESVWKLLPEILTTCDVVHITGKGKGHTRDLGLETSDHYFSLEFAHHQLPHLYAITDLALSRSGAGGISELAGNSITSILVPLRGLAQDHQWNNAESLRKRGGCVVIPQSELGEKLTETICDLVKHDKEREALATRLHELMGKGGAAQIVAIVEKIGQEQV
jgi:UDP-N-acetylglucosamine--N-acetylmuramyl-(pentapeptide) pyrophosphoryl-undecaprenol N-acetylglucosamine transferase